jgi:hypothetical protein
MAAITTEQLVQLLERLTGEPVPQTNLLETLELSIGPGGKGLGYSQLNELLLLAGLDRVTHAFFAYLLDGTTDYKVGSAFESIDALDAGIVRFRTTALLAYGNVKFAFKSLSQDEDLLRRDLDALQPVGTEAFEARHDPLLPLSVIAPEDAYLTGYLIESDLKARLDSNPDDKAAMELETRRSEIVKIALRNQAAYLASDHLDVYVATSMRTRHEFLTVGRLVAQIFDHESLKPLKLRLFDPTQAYCSNRIDKGLAEALMLRRASCTIYLAQETDTLGKDSELASTLAQGKPVIAFVPSVDEKYLKEHLDALASANPSQSKVQLLLDQLRLFEPGAAWTDPQVQGWIAEPDKAPLAELEARLGTRIRAHFDTRARTLRETHPLGIQVNLGTGVANGVMVVRTPDACARLVRGILTGTLSFTLDEQKECTALREEISGCIFRVMTADAMLTNTFWNFYLTPAE